MPWQVAIDSIRPILEVDSQPARCYDPELANTRASVGPLALKSANDSRGGAPTSMANNYSNGPTGGIDLATLWRILIDNRLVIGFSASLTTILAVVAAFVITPVYRAEVLMAPVTQSGQGGGLGALAGQFGGLASLAGVQLHAGNSSDEAIAILRSRSFTEDFVVDLDLLPIWYSESWDSEAGAWLVDDPKEIPTMWDAYQKFDKTMRRITENSETGLVTLAIEWRDRELATKWANELVARVNERTRRQTIDEARKSIEYLNKEVEKTSVAGLQQAIYGLIEDQINTIMLANVRDEYSFKVIDPAHTPDEDDFVKPWRAAIIAVGFFLGVFFGLFLAFFRTFLASVSSQTKED